MPAGSRTGWVFSPEFLRHNAGLPHPECPERLTAIIDQLRAEGVLDRLRPIAFTPAANDELARVHTLRYLDELGRTEGMQWDPDTYCGRGSTAIARLAAGGVIAAVRAVMRGECTNAFCAVRPPGHHALPDRAMGFCLINNVAVAAADAIASGLASHVLILDWDVHHGNGTQAIFYESSAVLYASTHQYPFYPGTGAAHDKGSEEGRGFTINRPLSAGDGDGEFLGAIAEILEEAGNKRRPDLVIISAGFDAHVDDPLASLRVTTNGFAEATRRVCAFSQTQCSGRLVSVLEGGYDHSALADSVAAHLNVLLSEGMTD